MGLSLESHHRAVDDSQATANMFIIFMERYLEKGITNLNQITGAFPINLKKQDTHNVMVLVQNLYKLVSEAHIDYYGNKKPRILKSHLEKYREGLIVGSSMTVHFSMMESLQITIWDMTMRVSKKILVFMTI